MKQSECTAESGSSDASPDYLTPEERILIMSWRENPELRRTLSRLLDLPSDLEE